MRRGQELRLGNQALEIFYITGGLILGEGIDEKPWDKTTMPQRKPFVIPQSVHCLHIQVRDSKLVPFKSR